MAIAGIILGIVGSAVTKGLGIYTLREERKMLEIRNGHEQARWGHERELVALQAKTRAQEFEMDAIRLQIAGSFEGLTKSIEAQIAAVKSAHKFGATVVVMMRPLITIMLLGAMFAVAYATRGHVQHVADTGFTFAAITELGSMAVGWWFGDRSLQRFREHTEAAGSTRQVN